MMIDAHIASFLTGFFLEPDAVSERWQLVKLIVFFLVHYILNSDNPPFSMKNYVALLIWSCVMDLFWSCVMNLS